MPALISESGRAITAHHSLLLINVIDCESQFEPHPVTLGEDAQPLLVEMLRTIEEYRGEQEPPPLPDFIASGPIDD